MCWPFEAMVQDLHPKMLGRASQSGRDRQLGITSGRTAASLIISLEPPPEPICCGKAPIIAWAASLDVAGTVSSWEDRRPVWYGFAAGGSKVLFRFGEKGALRRCVTEATRAFAKAVAISAPEAAGLRPPTRPFVGLQHVRVRNSSPPQMPISTGETFASRLRDIADAADCDWLRLKPPAEDCNDATRAGNRRRERKIERRGILPHARRLGQGEASPCKASP